MLLNVFNKILGFVFFFKVFFRKGCFFSKRIFLFSMVFSPKAISPKELVVTFSKHFLLKVFFRSFFSRFFFFRWVSFLKILIFQSVYKQRVFFFYFFLKVFLGGWRVVLKVFLFLACFFKGFVFLIGCFFFFQNVFFFF